MDTNSTIPEVSGISPSEGPLGTKITIRGKNLGNDHSDIISVFVCDCNCTKNVKWMSPSKLVCTIDSLDIVSPVSGPIKVKTRSGGEGVSLINFRITFDKLGALTPSSIWIDEEYRGIVPDHMGVLDIDVKEVVYEADPLGILPSTVFSSGPPIHNENFAQYSSKLADDSFHPIKFILDRHSNTSYESFKKGFQDLKKTLNCTPGSDIKSSDSILTRDVPIVITVIADLSKLSKVSTDKKYKTKKELGARIQAVRGKVWDFFVQLVGIYSHRIALMDFLSLYSSKLTLFHVPSTIAKSKMYKSGHFELLNICAEYQKLKTEENENLEHFIECVDVRVNGFLSDMVNRLGSILPTQFEPFLDIYQKLHVLNTGFDFFVTFVKSHNLWVETQLRTACESFHNVGVTESDKINKTECLEFAVRLTKFILDVCRFIDDEITTVLRFVAFVLLNFENFFGKLNEPAILPSLTELNRILANYISAFSNTLVELVLSKVLRLPFKDHHKNIMDTKASQHLLCSLMLLNVDQGAQVFFAIDKCFKNIADYQVIGMKFKISENPFTYRNAAFVYYSSFLFESFLTLKRHYRHVIVELLCKPTETEGYTKPVFQETTLQIYSKYFDWLLLLRCAYSKITFQDVFKRRDELCPNDFLIKIFKKSTSLFLKNEKNHKQNHLISFLATLYSVLDFLRKTLSKNLIFQSNWCESTSFDVTYLKTRLSEDLENCETLIKKTLSSEICHCLTVDFIRTIRENYFVKSVKSAGPFEQTFLELLLSVKKNCIPYDHRIYNIIIQGILSRLSSFVESIIDSKHSEIMPRCYKYSLILLMVSTQLGIKSKEFQEIMERFQKKFDFPQIDLSSVIKKNEFTIKLLKVV